MSSFISSSKTANARRIIIFVGTIFVLLEIFVRVKLIPMSKDLMNVGVRYPRRAKRLMRRSGFHIALVGNSATARGVDPAALEKALEANGTGPVSVEAFTADASHINTWYFMMKDYFWKQKCIPDLTVVLYFKYSLEDGHVDEIGRLAQCLTTREDWSDVFGNGLDDPSKRMEFIVSSEWASFAVRDRLEDRVFGLAAPDYMEFARRLNVTTNQHKRRSVRGQASPPGNRTLLHLLHRAGEYGEKLCFVAYPTRAPERYELNPLTVRTLAAADVPFIDLRHVGVLSPDKYADDIHLNAQGKALFSRCLGASLAPVVHRMEQEQPSFALHRAVSLH